MFIISTYAQTCSVNINITPDQLTILTPNLELHMQPHLPTFYHNNTLLYCILSF